ncbi:MAG: TonB-dependent receptor plug domain-containing protein [Bacteroidetes bacterium]|nr:TonB-dependent receptor plug domain-containing protein [Bacteroidota bacterium]
MNKTTLDFLIVTLFFFSFTQIQAQTIKEEKQALISVLKKIESQYDVRFSYADANLINKTINVPPKDLSLEELLKYLENNTSLIFEKLNSNSIIIRRLPKRKPFKTQYLNEILITNFLTKGISTKNDGSINIEPQQFGILPGLIEPDVLQTIQALPGVLSVDERVSNINIRGGTHDQNLILWDGIKMYQSGHFFGLISAFNPYLTENVMVSKNGTSAMYGDGVSSIIDMQSSNTIEDEFSGGAGLNMINVDVFGKIPLGKKTELQLSARRSVTDLIETPTFDQYFKRIFQDTDITNNQGETNNSISKNESFYFYDVTAKLLHNISKKDKIRINFLNIYNRIDYEEQSRINDVNEKLNSNLTQRNLASGIEYLRDWNTNFSTTAQIYLSNYDLDATNFDVLNNQRLIQENEVYDGGLKLHYKYNINNNLSSFGGYQFTEVGISNLEDVNNPVFRRFIKEVIRTHSVFNELKYSSKSNNTNAKIGVRANYIEKFSKTLIEPRLSFSQRFLNHFRLEILGEIKSQTTSQIIDLQNDFLGVEKRRWILSNNEDIPIIKSEQISAGIHFNKNKLLISTEAYIKEVDGITTRSQGFQNQFQFENKVGSYRIKGVDFLINKQFSNISIWLSYSYSKNDYTFKDLNFSEPFPNNVDITHALTFAGTYTLNDFKFAIGVNWRTGKPITKPDTQTPITNNIINYNTPNSSNLDDYLRADFSGTYTFQIGNTSDAIIGFSLWNLLDRSNIVNTYYTIDDNDTVTKIENQSLGITPNVSFRVRF